MRLFFATAVLVLCAGCANAERRGGEAGPKVVASVYPLEWAVERIAGEAVDVVGLTRPGAEPHDLELSPRDVEVLRDASLVVYVGGGFQPAVEDAVARRDGVSLDVRTGRDPHVWLDPVLFAQIVERVAQAVGEPGSSRAAVRDLRRLDAEYERGLERCERRTVVTTHRAFGRLVARYGLSELSLAGTSPEAEPGPRELERLVASVRASDATTVFAEPLVSSRLAETVAREAGLDVGVLDPVEGLREARLAAGDDYLSVMRDNLAALRKALGCRRPPS